MPRLSLPDTDLVLGMIRDHLARRPDDPQASRLAALARRLESRERQARTPARRARVTGQPWLGKAAHDHDG
jgi:hypothetical protein